MAATTSLAERADALEQKMSDELDVIYTKSALANMEDGNLGAIGMGMDNLARHPGKLFLIGDDPRLPEMPAKPTLVDFFRCRFAGSNHLLQSGTHALKAGMSEKTILACLLHDIAVSGFIRRATTAIGARSSSSLTSDEEVSWAIRAHQALRFFPGRVGGLCQYPVPTPGISARITSPTTTSRRSL